MKITKAQREALSMVARSAMVPLNLGTARALIRRGLIERTSLRSLSPVGGSLYYITDAGRTVLAEPVRL